MEVKEKKSFAHYMRVWHRYAGFFIVGLVLVYGLSGITLIFRDTDFLKKEKKITLDLSKGINPSELGSTLRMRDFKVEKTEGDIIYFKGGSYNTVTGAAEQTINELIFPLNKLTNLHKTPSKNVLHWFTLSFGIVMLFLALSSLFMFKSGSKVFRKGMLTVAAGVVFVLILLMFVK
jgi:hypothetical protein